MGDDMKDRERQKWSMNDPDTVYDLINKYGTYEIQPTADTDNAFPKKAQGLPKKKNRNRD